MRRRRGRGPLLGGEGRHQTANGRVEGLQVCCACGEVLLFPSPYHGVLAVKGGAPMALASWRPSLTPDSLRCAVLATVPGNSARATGDRHERTHY